MRFKALILWGSLWENLGGSLWGNLRGSLLGNLRGNLWGISGVLWIGLVGCSVDPANPFSNLTVPNSLGVEGRITPVADIYQQPETAPSPASDGSQAELVYVQGQVVQRVPLLGGWLYQVQDQTGLIWIATTAIAPELGDRVTVKGTVAFESVPIADEEMGEHYIQEIEHTLETADP